MSFGLLLRILEDEAGADVRARVESRLRDELGGQRIYIGTRVPLRPEQVEQAGPDPHRAARRLGVHRSTVWRLRRLVR